MALGPTFKNVYFVTQSFPGPLMRIWGSGASWNKDCPGHGSPPPWGIAVMKAGEESQGWCLFFDFFPIHHLWFLQLISAFFLFVFILVSALALLLPSQPHRVEKPQVSVARKPERGFHHSLSVASWASHTNFLCFGFFICPMRIGGNSSCCVWCIGRSLCMQYRTASLTWDDRCQSI